MQADLYYDPRSKQFMLCHYAKSTSIPNALVSSGSLECYSEEQIRALGVSLLQSSFDGCLTRPKGKSEFYARDNIRQREDFVNRFPAVFLTKVPNANVVSVWDMRTREQVSEITFPFCREQVEKLIDSMISTARASTS